MIHALHADKKDTAWVECNGLVGAELRLHSSTASVAYIPGILEAGVEVLIFAGAEDLICNYKGLEEMIQAMEWSGVQGWGVSCSLFCSHLPTLCRADPAALDTLRTVPSSEQCTVMQRLG